MNTNDKLGSIKKQSNIYLVPLVLIASLISACGSSTSDTTNNNASIATDITDVILTKTSANCADYVDSYQSTALDVNRSVTFNGNLSITVTGNKCVISTNAIPNHDFNDGSQSFATNVSEQSITYEMTTTPVAANTATTLSLTMDNAIFLNGIKLDILPAACYGVGDGKVGCNNINQPWRYDPMYSLNGFATDSHNAHTQPDGAYHYHGSPMAMFYSDTAIVSPVVGFAADGFPIFGSYFDDAGTIRKATSSYQLKSGSRVAINSINPGGVYDGTYRDDYEYSVGLGDLDECNGMTLNGVYGYYITDTYPWVLACIKGTPDASFNK